MEQFISPQVLMGNNAANNDKSIQQAPQQQLPPQQFQAPASTFDFSSFQSPSDILAPHPDLFESELDSQLAGFDPTDLQTLIDSEPDAFAFFRTETPTCGPPSTFTVSSESAYETLSSYSESIYNQTASEIGLPLNFDMDFARASISAHHSDYGNSVQHQQLSAFAAGLEGIPETKYGFTRSNGDRHSPASASGVSNGQIELSSSSSSPVSGPTSGSVYSGYNSSSEYPPVAQHPSLAYNAIVAPNAGVSNRSQGYVQQPQGRSPSPVGIGLSMSLVPRITRTDANRTHVRHPSSGHQGPSAVGYQHAQAHGEHRHGHGHGHSHTQEASSEDPRKKHRCPQCSRSFARAFNLKTHMATHDPHRQKQYNCTHANCDRSFSRKHDLGRHLVAIHRDDPDVLKNHADNGSDVGSAYSHRSIGVAAGNKFARCDKCGASGPKRCACKSVGK